METLEELVEMVMIETCLKGTVGWGGQTEMENFTTAQEYTGIQLIHFNSHKWGHEFIN